MPEPLRPDDPNASLPSFRPLTPPLPPRQLSPRSVQKGRITATDLRAMRARHRKSQGRLASDIGSSQQNISRYESGAWHVPYDLYPALMMWDANNPKLGLALAVINPQTHEVWRIIG